MDDWDRPVSEEERNAALARLGAFMDKMAKAGITEEEVRAAIAEDDAREARAKRRRENKERAARTGSVSTPAR